MRSLIFIFTVIALFIGCTKIPEKTDIEEILNKIEEERAVKCGDGIKDEWEECDFKDVKSCGEFDNKLLGPYQCNNCKIDSSGCVDIIFCNLFVCSENNKHCMEALDYSIYCDCVEGYSGENCDECASNFHYDLDGSCISDEICSVVGCNKRSECRVVYGQAECKCYYEFKGDNCDECTNSDYYYENGECKSNSCSYITCSPYEKCISAPGEKPVCVCKYETQDPTDCSKCLPGYAWALTPHNNEYNCVNSQIVDCTSNPDKPANSQNIYSQVTITYSEKDGWSEPAYCQWECMTTAYLENGECHIISINKQSISNTLTMSVDKLNNFYLFTSNGVIYKLNGTNFEQIDNLSFYNIQDIKILPDSNYFFMANSKNGANYDIYLRTPDGREIMKVPDNSGGKNSILTFTKGGKIFQGDTELTFPDSQKIHSESTSTASSITVTDESGNTYTVYSDGFIYSSSSGGTPRWSKSFENISLSLKPALSKEKILYVPYKDGSNSTGVYIINTDDGTVTNTISTATSIHFPTVSVGTGFIVVSFGSTYVQKLTKDGALINSGVSGSSIVYFSPVIMDVGKIYSVHGFINAYDEDMTLLWKNGNSYIKAFPYNNLIIGSERSYIEIFNAPGTSEGDWPQYLHDSMQSGSLADIEFVDPPSAPELISPADNFISDSDEITFSWTTDSADPTVKYTLLLRDYSGYDRVVASPEVGLSSFTTTLNKAENYEWRVVSQDSNGSLNVSESRELNIKGEKELWIYQSDETISNSFPATNDNGDIIFSTPTKMNLLDKNGTLKSQYGLTTPNVYPNPIAVNNEFLFLDYISLVHIDSSNNWTKHSSSLCSFSRFVKHVSGRTFVLCLDGDYYFTPYLFEDGEIIQLNRQNGRIGSSAVISKEGMIFAGSIIDFDGELIASTSINPLIFQDGELLYQTDLKNYVHEGTWDIWNLEEKTNANYARVFRNGEFSSILRINEICSIITGTMDDLNWREIYSWSCPESVYELVVSSDGTFFIPDGTDVFAVKEGEGELWRVKVGYSKAHGLTLTEDGALYVMSGNRFISLQNDSSGSNPLEWSQFRANAQRTACEPSETYNLMPSLKLLSPAKNTVITEDSFTFSWESTDPENESLTFDLDLGIMENSKKKVIYSVSGLTDQFHEVVGQLPEKSTVYWKVTAKDASGAYNVKESLFTTSSFPPEPWQKIFPLPTNSPVQNKEGVFYYSSGT